MPTPDPIQPALITLHTLTLLTVHHSHCTTVHSSQCEIHTAVCNILNFPKCTQVTLLSLSTTHTAAVSTTPSVRFTLLLQTQQSTLPCTSTVHYSLSTTHTAAVSTTHSVRFTLLQTQQNTLPCISAVHYSQHTELDSTNLWPTFAFIWRPLWSFVQCGPQPFLDFPQNAFFARERPRNGPKQSHVCTQAWFGQLQCNEMSSIFILFLPPSSFFIQSNQSSQNRKNIYITRSIGGPPGPDF